MEHHQSCGGFSSLFSVGLSGGGPPGGPFFIIFSALALSFSSLILSFSNSFSSLILSLSNCSKTFWEGGSLNLFYNKYNIGLCGLGTNGI